MAFVVSTGGFTAFGALGGGTGSTLFTAPPGMKPVTVTAQPALPADAGSVVFSQIIDATTYDGWQRVGGVRLHWSTTGSSNVSCNFTLVCSDEDVEYSQYGGVPVD